jgi:hypothetical protein
MSIISNSSKGGNSSSFAGVHQILNGLQSISDNTSELNVAPITGVVTSALNVTVAGPAIVEAGKRTISFLNYGSADAEVNGAHVPAGVTITYPELSNRDTYGAIPYNALTSSLLITTAG